METMISILIFFVASGIAFTIIISSMFETKHPSTKQSQLTRVSLEDTDRIRMLQIEDSVHEKVSRIYNITNSQIEETAIEIESKIDKLDKVVDEISRESLEEHKNKR